MHDAIGLTRPSNATVVVNNMMKMVNQAKYDEAIKSLLTAVRENMKPFPATTQELYSSEDQPHNPEEAVHIDAEPAERCVTTLVPY